VPVYRCVAAVLRLILPPTEQIVELRDRGLTRTEVAKQAHMTVSGAWSRYQKAGRRSPHAWAVGSTAVTTRITNRGWI
jgi:hypothetical protein